MTITTDVRENAVAYCATCGRSVRVERPQQHGFQCVHCGHKPMSGTADMLQVVIHK